MKSKYILIFCVLAGLAMLSCTGGVSSPKSLAIQVFMALQNDDVNAYLRLCGGIDEQLYLYNRSDMDKDEKNEDITYMLDNRRDIEKDLEEERRENFQEVQSEYDWNNFKLDYVDLDNEDVRDGIKFYRDIGVYFKNGYKLEIDIVVNTQNGYKVMDDVALSVE